MAITEGVEFVPYSDPEKKTLKERLNDWDNVVNLQGKIKDLDTKTTPNENEEAVNQSAENDFDKFFLQNESKIKTFFS
jgi:hypothetical protein